MRTMRIALAQINPTVGDLEGNTQKICEAVEEARRYEADIIAFPEMVIPGYPPEDLLLKPQFIRGNQEALKEVVKKARGITAIVGFVDSGDDIYNAAAILHEGALAGTYHKIHLPNYGVFDEDRYFQAGSGCPVWSIKGVTFGVNICEDIWYPDGPATTQCLHGGAQVIVNISASPYHVGKWRFREKMLATRAKDNSVVIAYVNMVGGQDELIFDGGSIIVDENGNVIARGKQFEEQLLICDVNCDAVFRARLHDPRHRKERLRAPERETKRILLSQEAGFSKRPFLTPVRAEPLTSEEEVYGALILGVRDYVRKNGFSKVLTGLSGGIDSSLTAAIAVDALGKENVIGVFMPSRFTSRESEEDSAALAQNLGITRLTIPIQKTFEAYLSLLADQFAGLPQDETEENIQSRIRGNILMALSNKFRWLVLTTGNKSEMSVGYATLYGDMAGGFAVIRDVPKTLVYTLARYRNRKDTVIPERVLEKAPTAELKPGQTDQDTLPPYDLLDPIIQAYVEEDKGGDEIVSMGFTREIVESVIAMVDRNEYKRRQAPVGIKITPRAFGKDRRMPITNRYGKS